MIPLSLTLSGFLSYRDPVELDFTSIDLACISGLNGSGKSSLLDAITWALFGQARKRDDSIINAQSNAAEVSLVFAYENNIYRVQRTKPRDKTAMLEFQIQQPGDPAAGRGDQKSGIRNQQLKISIQPTWKPLTERTLRETELRIQETLRLDYETFVNASFFLQGKADQFTQQRPGDRKRILGSILGLEIWETYRLRAAERRKVVENEIANLEGRLREISSELAEENERRQRLDRLEVDLKRLSKERKAQETTLENIRKIAATLAEQRKLVEAFHRQWQASVHQLDGLNRRLEARCSERDSYTGILAHAAEIQAAYTAWQEQRASLERWEGVAAQFREQEKRRQEPLDEINAARARLEQERQTLELQKQQIYSSRSSIDNLKSEIGATQQAIQSAEAQLALRSQRDAQLQSARQKVTEAQTENRSLKPTMDELKERIAQLTEIEGAACPLCGQELPSQNRQELIKALTAQGKEMGDRYRANLLLVRELETQARDLAVEINDLARAELALRAHTQTLARLTNQLDVLELQESEWQSVHEPRLERIKLTLEKEDFAAEARTRLSRIDAELKAIGYDAAAHDAARQAELAGRAVEAELRALDKAQATLAPLEREISNLQSQITALQSEVNQQQSEHDRAASALAVAEAQAPDLDAAESALFLLQEQENRLRSEVGAARQKVLVLEDLKARQQNLNARREEQARLVGQYKQLERAFGKDGVPALLIEQALPQIENKANEILDRLTGGAMSVRFVTQSAYKDKRRDDLKETLDIQISDGAGARDYEMFSGGEAFRVNFALRLALSEILAQRAGARLQTLVIDEGFGSQDALGRQRLVEAITLVRSDFAKILVITHIDELKDQFPNRIEVEKTERGSVARVVQ